MADVLLRRTVTLNPFIPHEPTPLQGFFLSLPVLEALYGGAAGGGKSDALLMGGLQYVDRPEYAAILFRRTYADLALPGALMDRAAEWLMPTAATWDDTEHTWTFPSGASLSFGYLQHERDRYRYQSSEFQYCVARGTPVLMADGRWVPIEAVQVGDMVATLEGPRAVTATHRPGTKPVCRVDTDAGTVLVGLTHRLLLASGAWAAPEELISTQWLPCDSSVGASSRIRRGEHKRRECRRQGPQRADVLARRSIAGTVDQDFAACLRGDRNGAGAYADGPRAAEPSPLWSGWLAGFARALLSTGAAVSAAPCVHRAASPLGSPSGCPIGPRSDDGRVRRVGATVRDSTPRRDDVATRTLAGLLLDGQASIPARTHRWYVHPYTTDRRRRVEAVRPVAARIARSGVAEVFDLTVACASHYIVSPGIIASNCGWDELTQFEQRDYAYLFSRLRRPAGSDLPLRVRAGTNPGGVGHAWVHDRFLVTGRARGRLFVPARLSDNPHIDQESYVRALSELDDVTRAQLLDGQWVVDERTHPYDRAWWDGRNRYDAEHPPKAVARFISWDTAESTVDGAAYTAAVVGELTADYRLLIRDVWRARVPFPELTGAITDLAGRWDRDGQLREVVVEEASSGRAAIQTLRATAPRWLAGRITGWRPRSSKLERAQRAATWCGHGMVLLPEPHESVPWLWEFERELYAMPDGVFRDQADAFAQLVIFLERWLRNGYRGA